MSWHVIQWLRCQNLLAHPRPPTASLPWVQPHLLVEPGLFTSLHLTTYSMENLYVRSDAAPVGQTLSRLTGRWSCKNEHRS